MNFNQSDDRRMLADSLDRYLAEQYPIETRHAITKSATGYSPEQWAKFAELGLIGALFTEAQGGFGGTGFDIATVFESLGRGLVVEPVLATAVLAGSALAHAGNDAQKALIEEIIAGGLIATLAHEEADAHYALNRVSTRATRDGDHYVIDGAKAVVPFADQAQQIIVSARTSGNVDDEAGISLFVVPAGTAGLSLRAYGNVDGTRAAEVTLKQVRVPASALLGAEGQATPRWSTPSVAACWPWPPSPWARWKSARRPPSSTCRRASSLARSSAASRPCNTAWPPCCSKSNRPARP